ncbi:MAG TPA: hypothetical protein VKM55_00995 [Candidatus Lokiarchaeia archaeon]|nr:hypothetical protein [Candidatus Lokiarchaeia archaeon]
MLEELFSDKNTALIIEYFLLHERWEQNQKDLCDEFHIYQTGMKKILENLVNLNIIKITRQIAKSKFYTLNTDSKIVNALNSVLFELNSQCLLRTAAELPEKEKDLLTNDEIERDEQIE